MEFCGVFAASNGDGGNQRGSEQIGLEGGNSSIVVSVVENRAREICICKLDTHNASLLEIFLLTDNHAYNEAIRTLTMINPDEILLHDGVRSGILSKKVELEFSSSARVLYISRQYFDQDRGADLLKRVLRGEVDGDLVAKYTVLSGSYCLLRYLENCGSFSIAPHSMRVEYGTATNSKMSIDRRTAVNLELISNAKNGDQKESLFGAIDNTKTVVGGRLLRSNILRPSTDIVTINTRLDLVELFLRNNRAFTEVVALLQQFPDLDKMLSGLTCCPKKITQKAARAGIDTLIYLKQALKIAPALANALSMLGSGDRRTSSSIHSAHSVPPVQTQEHPLVAAMITNLSDPVLRKLEAAVLALVTESTYYSKSVHEMRYQECFALHKDVHGLLDVARKTFQQVVEDIHKLAAAYSQQYGVPIKVSHSTSRGYFLSVPSALDPLPAGFTQAVLNKRTISCSTEELTSLSDRANEAITQALTLTFELIQNLLAEVRESIDALFILTDTVAMLDMLTSFADLVALSPHPYTRPMIHADGPIVVKAGRHPVVSTLSLQQLTSSFVANDLFMSPLENLHVVTGPNGAGKTVYIKQTALIVIMAQIGCFVPAKHATVPIRDRILSRIGTSDDMEHNMSTFFTEMKEISYVLSNLTSRSLIIIDELGRGTSTIDGLSIAFSISEHLLGTEAMTLFVTHYPQITSLVHMYPNVKNVHLKTAIDATELSTAVPATMSAVATTATAPAGSTSTMKYLHEVGTGPCDMKSGYGLIMAEQSGFPKEVLGDARHFRNVVRDKFPVLLQQQHGTTDRSLSALNSLLQQLLLLKNSTLDSRAQLQYLNNLRERIPDQTALETCRWLDSMLPADSSSPRSDSSVSKPRAAQERKDGGEVNQSSAVKVTPMKSKRTGVDQSPRAAKLKRPAAQEDEGDEFVR